MRFNFGGNWHAWGAGLAGEATTYDTARVGRNVLTIAGATVTFWDAPQAGNQYIDLLDDFGSSVYYLDLAVAGGSVPQAFIPRFMGPDGVTVLYAQAGSAPRLQMVASDAHLYLQPSIENLSAMQAQANALSGEIDVVEATRSSQNSSATNITTRLGTLRSGRLRQAAMLRPTASITLTSSVWTTIPFGAETFDGDYTDVNAGGHSTVSNVSRYTAQVAGYYLLGGTVAYNGSNVGSRYARWLRNGAVFDGCAVVYPANSVADAGQSVPAPTRIVSLNVGDYVELQGFQNTGGSLSTEPLAGSAPLFNLFYLRAF